MPRLARELIRIADKFYNRRQWIMDDPYGKDIEIRELREEVNRTGNIKNVITASRKEELNGEHTLYFETILNKHNDVLINNQSMCIVDDEYYDVVSIKKEYTNDGSYILSVEAEPVRYRLVDYVFPWLHTDPMINWTDGTAWEYIGRTIRNHSRYVTTDPDAPNTVIGRFTRGDDDPQDENLWPDNEFNLADYLWDRETSAGWGNVTVRDNIRWFSSISARNDYYTTHFSIPSYVYNVRKTIDTVTQLRKYAPSTVEGDHLINISSENISLGGVSCPPGTLFKITLIPKHQTFRVSSTTNTIEQLRKNAPEAVIGDYLVNSSSTNTYFGGLSIPPDEGFRITSIPNPPQNQVFRVSSTVNTVEQLRNQTTNAVVGDYIINTSSTNTSFGGLSVPPDGVFQIGYIPVSGNISGTIVDDSSGAIRGYISGEAVSYIPSSLIAGIIVGLVPFDGTIVSVGNPLGFYIYRNRRWVPTTRFSGQTIRQFSTTSARDTHFSNNPNEFVIGVTAAIVTNENIVTFSRYQAASGPYKRTPLTASDVINGILLALEKEYRIFAEVSYQNFDIFIKRQTGNPNPQRIIRDRDVTVLTSKIDLRTFDHRGNPSRFYECQYIPESRNEFSVGDVVLLYDEILGITEDIQIQYPIRVLSVESNPYDNTDNRIKMGNIQRGIEARF